MLLLRLHLHLLIVVSTIVATTQAYVDVKAFERRRRHPSLHSRHHSLKTDCPEEICSRRNFIGGVAATGVILLSGPDAEARDDLFKSNPLTNPVLEQLRIWEQAEADNIKYDGELEAGDAGNKGKVGAYPKLLVPILTIDRELEEVRSLVRDESRPSSWERALKILQDPKYDKVAFKKTFNAYGDNIYYSDPDRANLYLGGGATPKTEQSIAYLLRNDILTNMENLRAELEFLLKNPSETELEDLYSFADICADSMKRYLAIVPPSELEQATKML